MKDLRITHARVVHFTEAMRRGALVKSGLAALAVLASGSGAVAQGMGTAFTYQGRLFESGTAANGLFDLRFTLFPSSNSTTVVAGPKPASAASPPWQYQSIPSPNETLHATAAAPSS